MATEVLVRDDLIRLWQTVDFFGNGSLRTLWSVRCENPLNIPIRITVSVGRGQNVTVWNAVAEPGTPEQPGTAALDWPEGLNLAGTTGGGNDWGITIGQA